MFREIYFGLLSIEGATAPQSLDQFTYVAFGGGNLWWPSLSIFETPSGNSITDGYIAKKKKQISFFGTRSFAVLVLVFNDGLGSCQVSDVINIRIQIIYAWMEV